MKPTISFSFDDGYRTVYDNAFFYMQKKNITGTVYVITDKIGHRDYLNIDQICELYENGWEIASHTHTHPRMNRLSQSELRFELEHSKQMLQDLIREHTGSDYAVKGFAYPYGDANAIGIREILVSMKYYKYARINANRMSGNKHIVESSINNPPYTRYFLLGRNPWFGGIDDFKLNIKTAIDSNGWYIFYTHSVDQSSRPTDSEFIEMRDYAAKLREEGKMYIKTIEEVLSAQSELFCDIFPASNIDNYIKWSIQQDSNPKLVKRIKNHIGRLTERSIQAYKKYF